MTAPTTTTEKIYRVWSDRKQDTIAVRLQFSVEEIQGCRIIRLGAREEWQ